VRSSQTVLKICCLLAAGFYACLASAAPLRLELEPLPALSGGVSERTFGTSNGALLVAGGTDGASTVWVLPPKAGEWEQHSLPKPLNAAAATSDGSTMYCPGGDALRWENSRIHTLPMPALPRAFEKGGAAILEGNLYFAGGKTPSFGSDPQSFNDSIYSLNLNKPEAWIRLEEAPPFSPRIRPIVISQAGSLFVIGGWEADGSSSNQGWTWKPGKGWREIAAPPFPLAASASFALGPSTIVHVGGDISRAPSVRQTRVLVYNTLTNTWADLADSELPRVGAGVAFGDGVAMFASSSATGRRELSVFQGVLRSPKQALGAVGWSIVLGYLGVMLAIGLAFFRHKDTNQFLTADYDVPWWAAAASYQATALPVLAMLTLPALAFVDDQRHAMQYAFAAFAVWLLGDQIAPVLRRLGVATIFEYLESRFDARVRVVVASLWLLGQVALIAVSLAVAGLALSVVVGGGTAVWVLALGATVTACVAMGGMRASIWSDVLQLGLILLASGVCLALILNGSIGASGIWRVNQKLRLIDQGFSLNAPVIWVMAIGGFCTALTQLGDQSLMQRVLTTRGPRDCKRALYAQYIIGLPIIVCLCLGGSAVYAWLRANPQFIMPTISADLLWLHVATQQLPGLVGVLVLVALLSAAMSTADSGCHSIATVATNDLIRRFVPDWDDATFLKMARGLVLAGGMLSTFLAGWMTMLSRDLLVLVFAAVVAIFGGGVGSVMALGLLTRQAHSAGVLIGVVVSVVGTGIAVIALPLHPALYAVVALGLGMGGGLIASFAISSVPRNLHGLTVYTLRSDE
jgi:Na+/proline symporter